MNKRSAMREWRAATRDEFSGEPTPRVIHAFAQRVEALAISGCDKRHAADIAELRERFAQLAEEYLDGTPEGFDIASLIRDDGTNT